MTWQQLRTWERLCAAAAVVTFVAAFLPWVSAFGISVAGIRGDGQITVLCAVIGAAALAASHGIGPIRLGRRLVLGIQLVTAVLVTLVGLVDMADLSAIGLYLTLLAGIAWCVGVVMGIRDKPLDTPV
jgi:hypothetical protein